MKLPLTVATLLLAAMAFAPTANGQRACACKAADGSCNVNVSCKFHGCTAVCASNDGCYARCGEDLIKTRFTVSFRTNDGKEIAAALSKRVGHKIEFAPRPDVSGPFIFDIKDDDMWNVLDYLYDRGTVKVDGVDWGKYRGIRTVLKGGRVSVEFNNISVRDALAHLSFLSGKSLHAVWEGQSSRNHRRPARQQAVAAQKEFSLSLQDVTLDEIVARISAETGVQIQQEERAARSRNRPVKSRARAE